jgi:hypothetical protein
MRRAGALVAAVAVCLVTLVVPSMRASGDGNSEFVANFAPSVPGPARVAIQAALDEWASRVATSVPVVVDINWEALPRYVAAASEPLGFAVDPATGFYVPIALANARAGVDLDPSHDDIKLTLASGERWNYDPTVPATPGVVDLMTITLHEIGHGIGFYSSSHKEGGLVVFGANNGEGAPGPTLLDGMLMTRVGTLLVDQHPVANVVSTLRAALGNNDVIWSGSARDASGQPPRMSSGAFEPHSSLMHLDENTYPAGNPDSLMTTVIRRGETQHSIGPAALGIVRDLGWTVTASGAPAPAPQAQPATAGASKAAAAAKTDAAVPTPAAETPTTAVTTPGLDVAGKSAHRSAAGSSAGGTSSSVSPVGLIVAALVIALVVGRVVRKMRRVSAFLESIGLGALVHGRFHPFAQFAGIDD